MFPKGQERRCDPAVRGVDEHPGLMAKGEKPISRRVGERVLSREGSTAEFGTKSCQTSGLVARQFVGVWQETPNRPSWCRKEKQYLRRTSRIRMLGMKGLKPDNPERSEGKM